MQTNFNPDNIISKLILKGRGGHEKWSRSDLERPVTIQTHVNPVPEFIILQVLRHIGISKKQFFEAFHKK